MERYACGGGGRGKGGRGDSREEEEEEAKGFTGYCNEKQNKNDMTGGKDEKKKRLILSTLLCMAFKKINA